MTLRLNHLLCEKPDVMYFSPDDHSPEAKKLCSSRPTPLYGSRVVCSASEYMNAPPNLSNQSSVTCQSTYGFTITPEYFERSPRLQDDSYQP